MISSSNIRRSLELQRDTVGSSVGEYTNTPQQYSHDISFANSPDSSSGYNYLQALSYEPGHGSYSSLRSGYSQVRHSGYSGASLQDGRRHSVDAYGTYDSLSNRSSLSRNNSLLHHLSTGRGNLEFSSLSVAGPGVGDDYSLPNPYLQNYSFQDRKGELALQGSASPCGLPTNGLYELSSETSSFSRTPRHNASPSSTLSTNPPLDPPEACIPSKPSDSSLSSESVAEGITRQDSIRHIRQTMEDSSQLDSQAYPRRIAASDNARRFGRRFDHPIFYQMMMDPELRREYGLDYSRQISAPQLSAARDLDESLFGHALPSASTQDPLTRALHYSSPVAYSPSYVGSAFENQPDENWRSMNNRGNERRTEKTELKSPSRSAFPGSPRKQSMCAEVD